MPLCHCNGVFGLKIILAPNAFKESLTAHEAARAMERGFRRALPGAELIECPVADGGDGTAEVLARALGGRATRHRVTGPLGKPVMAPLLFLKEAAKPTCVIEMAKTSGLALVPPRLRNPMRTTTRGLGEMMEIARSRGAKRIIVTLGGSATVDGGAGMAKALGFKLLDARGREVPDGGAGLEKIAKIVPPSNLEEWRRIEIVAVCDVENPLLGKHGAAAVFGPQKGATSAMIPHLEIGLKNLASIWKQPGLARLAGAGAAGGLGAGLVGFLGATIAPGADMILDLIGFDEIAKDTDWIVTGEGKLDHQTLGGKAPAVVARRAAAMGIPVIGLAGSVEPGFGVSRGARKQSIWAGCFSIAPRPVTLEECMTHAAEWLENAAAQVGTMISSVTEQK